MGRPVGRPPTPIEKKRRTGNPGKRALPDAGNLAPVPAIEPMAHERSVEQALEDVLGAGVHWIASTDSMLVSLLREAVESYAELRDDPRSTAKEIREARKEVSDLLRDLGFTPGERSRLGLAEVKAASKLEELRARRASSSVAAEVVDSGD